MSEKNDNMDICVKAKLNDHQNNRTKVYKFRWIIMLMYVLYAASSAMQWIQYCIISNIVMRFYNISAFAVDWTSIITMVTYIPLIFPASYMVDKLGLRVSILIGTIFTTIGTWIKVFSAEPDLFWVGFLGQTVVFASQVFMLSLPPRIAAVWFNDDEVSTGCSLGVFGTQLGTALGFLLPPLLVTNHENKEDIGTDLSYMFYYVAIFSTIMTVLIIIYFKAEPEIPPSQAQLDLKTNKVQFTTGQFFASYKSLLTNKPFLLLLISYGMNVGVFAGICTVLNQFIISYFPDSVVDSGRIGLLMVIIGMLGSITFGYILDKSRKYKETTVATYILVALGVCGFMFALDQKSMVLVYISSAAMGFFQNAYYLVGFELATELTFPEPESTSSGLLLSMAQTFGIIFTLLMGRIFEQLGAFWALSAMIFLLICGCIITAFIPNILKRQQAFKGDLKIKNRKQFSGLNKTKV